MDKISPKQRSAVMRRVKSKNTTPEMRVRKLLWKLGYRYRIHEKSLPGTPDIVFTARKKVVQIHGCLWHGHDCKRGKLPQSNNTYWSAKIRRNIDRDADTSKALRALGWDVIVIWECELRSFDAAEARLRSFLGSTKLK